MVKVEGRSEPALWESISHTLPAPRAGGWGTGTQALGHADGAHSPPDTSQYPAGSSCAPFSHVGNATRPVPRPGTRPRPQPRLALEEVSDQRFYLLLQTLTVSHAAHTTPQLMDHTVS